MNYNKNNITNNSNGLNNNQEVSNSGEYKVDSADSIVNSGEYNSSNTNSYQNNVNPNINTTNAYNTNQNFENSNQNSQEVIVTRKEENFNQNNNGFYQTNDNLNRAQKTGRPVATLVLGIIGVLTSTIFVGLPVSIVGLIIAIGCRKEGEINGLSTAGLVLNIIGLCFSGLVVLFFIIGLAVAAPFM